MKKLSTGQASTLGNYLNLTKMFFGETSPAVKFLQDKIDKSPMGAEEEVIADESQMLHLLVTTHNNGAENRG